MKDNIEFIKGLELFDSSIRLPDYSSLELNIETPSYINFRDLCSFGSGVSEQTKEDVLNSFLLAQRAATKKYPEDSQVYDWYKFYFTVLMSLGWILNQKDFTEFSEKNKAFELDKAIIALLKDLLPGNQLNLLMKSLDLLKNMGDDDKRIVAFEHNTKMHSKGNMQLSLAEEIEGNVTIVGSGFVLESEQKITSVLFIKFDSVKTKLKFSFYKATLVSNEYNKYRDLVKEKLGDKSSFIVSLDL